MSSHKRPNRLSALSRGRTLCLLLMCCAIGGLAGCGVRHDSPQAFLAQRRVAPPTVQDMTVCTGFGCSRKAGVHLRGAEVDALDRLFAQRAGNAAQERQQLARAVALLEQMVGQKVGTGNDLARNSRNFAPSGQLDCIAEAANTTVYLLFLLERGNMAYHTVAPPEHRGATVFTAHNTAVIRDDSGREYALDSWFHANGELPELVPLDVWRAGFDPETARTEQLETTNDMRTEAEDGI